MKTSRLNFRIRSLSMAVAALGSAGALAQQNTLESIVVTADRFENTLRDVPASIYAVGGDALETVRATHINEILARVPGTWISRGNGQESLISIRSPVLTGTGSCGAFQTAQDGIPLRAPGFCNVNQLFEANTEQAGSIEVIRGPGSILYGANALHGAINIISDPVSENLTSDFSYELGPHTYNRVRGTVSNTNGQHGYRVSFNGNYDEGYKDDSGFGQQKLSMQHKYSGNDLSITTSFHATNLNQETAGFIQGHDSYKDSSQKRLNPNPESFRDASSWRLSSQFQWEGNNGNWILTPYARDTEMVFLQHFLPGTPLEENGQTSVGLQAMYVNAGNDMLKWQAGLDMEKTNGYLIETQDVPTVGSAFLVATIPVGKHYDFDVDAILVSPYIHGSLDLDDMNSLSLGVRYEYREYEYDNRMIDGRTKDNGVACGNGGCRFNRPADRSDDFSNVSAQLGWIHDFDDAQQVYANVARAFRAPETNELYRLQNGQNVADLDSEEARSFEVGYRASRSRASYSLSAYYMTKDNVIFQDSNRNNVSGAETRHRGIELNTVVALTDSLNLAAAYSYAIHTYEGNLNPGGANLEGLDIDTAPRLTGSTQLTWNISAERSVELEWVHMDSYFTDEANTAEYEGHELVNLRYQASWNGGWYYGARITNLFNTDYAERADYAFGQDRYFVGEPISLYLTIGKRL
jgi:iron complex outermembrane receptor protein